MCFKTIYKTFVSQTLGYIQTGDIGKDTLLLHLPLIMLLIQIFNNHKNSSFAIQYPYLNIPYIWEEDKPIIFLNDPERNEH